MPGLIWDKVGDRVYESGLDKGVLYLPDGSAVPWNGLTSVVEKPDKNSTPVYYDGRKINNLISVGSFEASLKAVTYPEEFLEIEGLGDVRHGMFLGEQQPKTFALCYRTQVGNDIEGDTVGYKINIVYNLTAVPSDKTYASMSLNPSIVEFEWDLLAVPEDIPGFKPTAHIIIDTRDYDPWLLEELSTILYGDTFADAALLPMDELVEFLRTWCRYHVTDNGDGTYTVSWSYPHGVTFSGTEEEVFTLTGIYAIHHDDGTVIIEDTCDISDIPEIRIIDNGDGTWTAVTEFEGLFATDGAGLFSIVDANAVFIAPDEYRLSDTTGG